MTTWPQGQQPYFEGVRALTLDCLVCELPPQIGRMAGLERLDLVFYTLPFRQITYPLLSGLQRLAELSIGCFCIDQCDDPTGTLPTDLDKLSSLVSFKATMCMDPACRLPVYLGTKLTKLCLESDGPWLPFQQGDPCEVSPVLKLDPLDHPHDKSSRVSNHPLICST